MGILALPMIILWCEGDLFHNKSMPQGAANRDAKLVCFGCGGLLAMPTASTLFVALAASTGNPPHPG